MVGLSVSPPADVKIDDEDGNTVRTTMSSLSAVTEAIAASDKKRDVVRQSIEEVNSRCASLVTLSLQWKEFEERYATIERSLDKQKKDLESKSLQVEWKAKRLSRKAEVMELRDKQLADKCKEIDATYALVAKCHSKVLDKEKDLSWNLGQAETTRKRMESLLKSLEQSERALESKEDTIRRRHEELDKREDDLRLREMSLNDGLLELNAREKKLLSIEREVREKSPNHNGALELSAKEKNLVSIERELMEKIQDLECKQEKFKISCDEMHKVQVKLRKERSFVKTWEQNLNSREKDLLEKTQIFNSQQKKLHKECKAFKEKERCVDSMLVQYKALKDVPYDADIRFYITMNGKELLQYLIRHVSEHRTMGDEVRRALSLSANPAKLVLDAIHGFHPPDSETRNRGFCLDVVRRTSIFLLEQLTLLKLDFIPEEEQERARLLAVEWKGKINTCNHHQEHRLEMVVDCQQSVVSYRLVDKEMKMRVSDCHQHSLEKVGFLKLVASYRLVNKFDEGELLKLLKMVDSPALYESLGLKDEFHGTGTISAFVADSEDRVPEEFDNIAPRSNLDKDTTSTERPSNAGSTRHQNSKRKLSGNQGSLSGQSDGQKKKRGRKNLAAICNVDNIAREFDNVVPNIKVEEDTIAYKRSSDAGSLGRPNSKPKGSGNQGSIVGQNEGQKKKRGRKLKLPAGTITVGSRLRKNGASYCYKCRKQGHIAKDCLGEESQVRRPRRQSRHLKG